MKLTSIRTCLKCKCVWVSSIHSHVSHCADQFAVLDDRGARHALHDTAGGVEQVWVCDFQQKVSAVGAALWIDFQNFHRIIPGRPAGYGGADGGGAGLKVAVRGYGDGLALPGGRGGAEDPLAGVGGKCSQQVAAIQRAAELARLAGFALLNGDDGS